MLRVSVEKAHKIVSLLNEYGKVRCGDETRAGDHLRGEHRPNAELFCLSNCNSQAQVLARAPALQSYHAEQNDDGRHGEN